MGYRSYLPSSQFAVIAVSLFLSGGLVAAAQYASSHHEPATVASAEQTASNDDWQQTLDQIQLTSGVSLPKAPSPEEVAGALKESETPNLTATVARSLFIKLTEAKAQGLGNDVPTQDQLVTEALAQMGQQPKQSYALGDLLVAPPTPETLRLYGNEVMRIFTAHPKANMQSALLAIGTATDNNDASKLAPLAGIGAEYDALARDLAKMAVPKTLAPLHLQVVNALAAMAIACSDMQVVMTDPVRGLAGVQSFQTLSAQASRVLTTIADSLHRDAILFSTDEPGALWSSLLSS